MYFITAKLFRTSGKTCFHFVTVIFAEVFAKSEDNLSKLLSVPYGANRTTVDLHDLFDSVWSRSFNTIILRDCGLAFTYAIL